MMHMETNSNFPLPDSGSHLDDDLDVLFSYLSNDISRNLPPSNQISSEDVEAVRASYIEPFSFLQTDEELVRDLASGPSKSYSNENRENSDVSFALPSPSVSNSVEVSTKAMLNSKPLSSYSVERGETTSPFALEDVEHSSTPLTHSHNGYSLIESDDLPVDNHVDLTYGSRDMGQKSTPTHSRSLYSLLESDSLPYNSHADESFTSENKGDSLLTPFSSHRPLNSLAGSSFLPSNDNVMESLLKLRGLAAGSNKHYPIDVSQEEVQTSASFLSGTSESKRYGEKWNSHLAGFLDEEKTVFPNSLGALGLLNVNQSPLLRGTKEFFGTINSEITSVYQFSARVVDNEIVYLKRAPDMFDRWAIKVENKYKAQIGSIQREHTAALAYVMDNNLADVEGKVHYSPECKFRIPVEILLMGDPDKKADVLRHFKRCGILVTIHCNLDSPIHVLESPIPFDHPNDYGHVVSSRTFVTPAEMENQLDQMFKTLDEGDKVTEAEAAAAIKTSLFPHQKQALNWMMSKENNDLLPPFWQQKNGLYINTIIKKQTETKPKSIYGGILADDMGLGKTLEMISLIMTNFVNGKPLSVPQRGYTRESFAKTSKVVPYRLPTEEGMVGSNGYKSTPWSCSPPRLKLPFLPARPSEASLTSVSNDCQNFLKSMKKEIEEMDKPLSELHHSASFPSFPSSRGQKRSVGDSSDDILMLTSSQGQGKRSRNCNLASDDQSSDGSSLFINLSQPDSSLKIKSEDGGSTLNSVNGFAHTPSFSSLINYTAVNELRNLAYATTNQNEGSKTTGPEGGSCPEDAIDVDAIDIDALKDIGMYEDISPVDSPHIVDWGDEISPVKRECGTYRSDGYYNTGLSLPETTDLLVSNAASQLAEDPIVISDSELELPDLETPVGLFSDRKKISMASTKLKDIDDEVEWKRREVTSETDPRTGRTLTNGPRGTLIICPLSVVNNWVDQFDEHVHRSVRVNFHQYYGQKRTRDLKFLMDQDVVLTTYNVVSSDYKKGQLSPLHQVEWLRVVLDEGHTIRNPAALQTKAIFELKAERRWVLTGTPIQNSLKDLWSLINFLQVKPFTEQKTWNKIIANPLNKRERQALRRVAHLVRNLAMRRTKNQHLNGKPLIDLPARHVYLETVTLNEDERKYYDEMHVDGQDIIGSYYRKGTLLNNYGTVLTILLRLRQICCHRRLVQMKASKKKEDVVFDDIMGNEQMQNSEEKDKLIQQLKSVLESGSDEECSICLESLTEPVITPCAHFYCKPCIEAVIDKTEGEASCPMCRAFLDKKSLYGVGDSETEGMEQLQFGAEEWFSSSKVDALMKALNQLRQEDPSIKSVVISQFTSLLTLVETPLRDQGFKFARLDGKMKSNDRAKAVREFSDLSPDSPTVFLLSLKAGGVGINLTAASRVFLLDPAWNPAAEDQCFDRCHRLGQRKDVVITKFVIEDSVEQRMLELQEKKRQLINGVLNKKLSADEQRKKRIEEIKTLFNI